MKSIPLLYFLSVIIPTLILGCVLFFIVKNKLSKTLDSIQENASKQSLLLMELQALYQDINTDFQQFKHISRAQQVENEQVSKHLEHRIKIYQEKLSTQMASLEKMQQQPEDRLYLRAQKLVELGADVDEIMKECDIPRVEAEIILSIHRKKR